MSKRENDEMIGAPQSFGLANLLQQWTPEPLKLPEIMQRSDPNLASEFHNRLVSWIEDYDKRLDNEHEVGIRLVNFGQAVTFRLAGLGFWNPSLIVFYGSCDDGTPVELIQHVSQISILLMTQLRLDPSTPKQPIGFRLRSQDDTSPE